MLTVRLHCGHRHLAEPRGACKENVRCVKRITQQIARSEHCLGYYCIAEPHKRECGNPDDPPRRALGRRVLRLQRCRPAVAAVGDPGGDRHRQVRRCRDRVDDGVCVASGWRCCATTPVAVARSQLWVWSPTVQRPLVEEVSSWLGRYTVEVALVRTACGARACAGIRAPSTTVANARVWRAEAPPWPLVGPIIKRSCRRPFG